MPKYLLIVDFRPGVDDTPIERWTEDEVAAHLDHYRALNEELVASGELVGADVLSPPDLSVVVTADGIGAPVVTDGPFAEFKEWVAGYQIVDVPDRARAVEIAARVSAVPGRGGRPLQQPVQVRRIMTEDAPDDVEEMRAYAQQAGSAG
ncbi:YciI family protein [Kineosporia sp. R_H_3]|uniref:YciI family protein n=1 Tax=Kineosporia sp. R_H_3 TaxID=1961848 RepID=UPI000B4B5217|nr:YciI family protein [Kineosporia sp. R_H_3]